MDGRARETHPRGMKLRACALSAVLALGVTGLAAGCAPHDARPVYVSAAAAPPQRAVNTVGEAEVRVSPDEVVLTVGAESHEPTLSAAKARNDEAVKQLLATAQREGIAAADLQTEYVEVEPRYESYERKKLIGFTTRRTMTILLRDVSRFEKLLTSLLEAGATNVLGIQFRTTKLRTYRDQARALAVHAAKEKADALAHELAQEVERPLTIDEEANSWFSPYSSWWGGRYSGAMQNVVQNAGPSAPSPEGTFAPGTIAVTARVRVSFALK